jgi:hypothetical protein
MIKELLHKNYLMNDYYVSKQYKIHVQNGSFNIYIHASLQKI